MATTPNLNAEAAKADIKNVLVAMKEKPGLRVSVNITPFKLAKTAITSNAVENSSSVAIMNAAMARLASASARAPRDAPPAFAIKKRA